jgi:RNA-directed DNA polymerase
VGLRVINSIFEPKSVSIVAELRNWHFNIKMLNFFCEETQLQQLKKEAQTFFQFLKKKLFRVSRNVRRVFTLENFTRIMVQYHEVIRKVESHHKSWGIYNIIVIPCFLWVVYLKIYKKTNVKVDDLFAKSMTFPKLFKIAQELRFEIYSPVSVKWAYISSDFSHEKHLRILSIRDKIVQQSLFMMLVPIFDATFSRLSHSFRPNRSCHSALKSVSCVGSFTVWFIEFDLVKAFRRIHHELLFEEIQMKIKDQQVINLVCNMFRVRYVDIYNLVNSKFEQGEKMPQASILNFLLANIFLHRLDVWVEKVLLFEYNGFIVKRVNPEHHMLVNSHVGGAFRNILFATKQTKFQAAARKSSFLLDKVCQEQVMQDNIKHCTTGFNSRKLWYVRYADDVLLGLIGPKVDAFAILEIIKVLIVKKLKIEMYSQKSRVKHHSDGVTFLGYHLFGKYNRQFNVSRKPYYLSSRIKFSIPILRLIEKYAEKGFLRRAEKSKRLKYVGRRVDKFIYFFCDNTVICKFNAILRGLSDYYSGSDYPAALNELYELLRRSCALTLAHRYKLKSVKSAIIRWGKNLTIKYKALDCKDKLVNKSISFELPIVLLGKWKRGNLDDFLTDSVS